MTSRHVGICRPVISGHELEHRFGNRLGQPSEVADAAQKIPSLAYFVPAQFSKEAGATQSRLVLISIDLERDRTTGVQAFEPMPA